MTSAEKIIGKLGGTRPAAKMLGLPISTVQSWKKAGHIPGKYHAEIMGAAWARSLRLRPADFFSGRP